MKLENQKILIVSNEPWSDVWFSKHNYAWELAKKNTVYFINSPSKWKWRNLFSKNISFIRITDSLTVVDIQNRFPSAIKWMKELNNYFASKKLVRNLPDYKKNDLILWTFTPLFLFRPKFLAPKFSIFHIVDQHWTTFYGTEQLASTADCFVMVSDKILDEYKKFKTPKFILGHGISEDEFEMDPQRLLDVKREMEVYGNFILFVGSIDHRIDFEFVKQLTLQCPTKNFVFIGPDNLARNHPYGYLFKGGNNIHCIGKRHYKEIKYYIKTASLCISPMDYNFPGNNIAHHKTLPYLAQGKKIISPCFLDYENLGDIMKLSNNPDELINEINDFDGNESDQIIDKRISVARNFSYNNHLKKIEDFINEACSTDNCQ